jgi:chitodextrinase
MSSGPSLFRRDSSGARGIATNTIGRLALGCILWATLLVSASPAFAGAVYIQGNSATNPNPTSSISTTFSSAQLHGDLNIVVVGVQQGLTISVADQSGNNYQLANGPSSDGGTGAQYIYYAANITAAAAGANTVTVTFSGSSAGGGSLRAVEYSGISTVSPLDGAAAATCPGTTNLCSSGSVTTTNAADLLVGISEYSATGPGPGYTERLDSTNFNLIVEDQVVYTTGSYSASVYVSPNGEYVTQIVAFKVASTGAYVQGNSATNPNPTSSISTTFSSAQLPGDLDIVVVGVQQGLTVSVADQSGNTYHLAIGPSPDGGSGSQYIYYASSIAAAAAGANTVTVTFSGSSAGGGSLRAVEYGGINPTNPLDGAASAICSGSTNLCSSGPITTTNAADLLIGVSEYSATAAGPGFTERLDSASFNLIIEDATVTGTGSYSASVYVSPNGEYVTQIAAFKIATGDTTPPTAPTALTATASSSSQIGLSWTASTDDIGVTGYQIQRCQNTSCTTFAEIGTATATTYSDSGLTTATSYSYRVLATDAAGNLSAYSNTASAITSASGPTVPAGLIASAASSSEIDLSWTASTDSLGVTGYDVERCAGSGCTAFAQIDQPTSITYIDSGLTASTTYSYRVRAIDTAGNLSGYSSVVSATTPATDGGGGGGGDTQAPTAPLSLTAGSTSGAAITLNWGASTDNVGVTGYLIEQCMGAGCTAFSQVTSTPTSPFTVPGLAALTTYTFRIRASDAAGNLSAYSNTVSATTGVSGSICD